MIALLLIYIFAGILTAIGWFIAGLTDHEYTDPVELGMAMVVHGILSVGFGAIWPISMPVGIYVLTRMQ